MVLYPDVQARARAEINQVVRHDRMPSIDDRASLPYLDAILLEVLRWYPASVLGLSEVCDFVLALLIPFHRSGTRNITR
jgi:cytochrome P450